MCVSVLYSLFRVVVIVDCFCDMSCAPRYNKKYLYLLKLWKHVSNFWFA